MAAARHACVCGRSFDTAEEMLQCSDCLRSIHLACASTRRSIAGNCVVCVRCLERNPPPRSLLRRSSSSTARARILLELKLLEEERILQEKAAEEKVMREKEYLTKKYDLMKAQLEEEEEGSAISRRSISSIQIVEQWLQNEPVANAGSGIGCSEIPAGTKSRTGTVHKPKPSISTAAAAISTPKSGQQAACSFGLNPSQPLDVSKWHSSGAQPAVAEYQTQDPLDWSLTWDMPVAPQSLAKGKYAVDLQEIQRKFSGVQLCPPRPNQQATAGVWRPSGRHCMCTMHIAAGGSGHNTCDDRRSATEPSNRLSVRSVVRPRTTTHRAASISSSYYGESIVL